MKVWQFRTEPSPLLAGYVRLSARLDYDDGEPAETLWYDLPAECQGEMSASGNSHLAALLILAMKLGEPLRIERPVDEVMQGHAMEMARVLRCWHPDMHELRLEVSDAAPIGALPCRAAAFFSGGIDAFFTALRPRGGPGAVVAPLEDLIYVWGLDLSLDKVQEFHRLRDHLATAAAGLGKRIFFLATNLRLTRAGRLLDWGLIHHGGALASIAHLLGHRWRVVYIGSSHTYRDLYPWGTHPLTDPLYSTSFTRLVHDGADAKRTEKTALIAQSPVARQHLHVCWRSNGDRNCCRCGKCCRTMATLDALGCLRQFDSFDAGLYNLRDLHRLFVSADCYLFLDEIIELATQRHRPDLVAAMRHSLRRSRRNASTRYYLHRLLGFPGGDRLFRAIERRMLARMVR